MGVTVFFSIPNNPQIVPYLDPLEAPSCGGALGDVA